MTVSTAKRVVSHFANPENCIAPCGLAGTMSAMSDKQKTAYTPTGKWEVYGEYDSNYETHAPVLVGPDGEVHSRWSPDDIGSSMAHSYADTYNLNEDKAAEFRGCPYCTKGCSWCGRVTV